MDAKNPKELLGLLPERYPTAHKGSYGRLLLIGGSEKMTGCMVLASQGALHSGVGILECACERDVSNILKLRLSEPVHTLIEDPFARFEACCQALIPRLSCATALAIGPGFAQGDPLSPRGEAVRDLILLLLHRSQCPVVLDADGLTVFQTAPHLLKAYGHRLVVTPHPGELSCLTKSSLLQIQQDRQKAAAHFSEEYGCVTLLKGHGTLVSSPEGDCFTNPTGNPYMARGGSGDVLTGIIGSLLAQGLSPFDAARLGAYLHGGAADLAAEELGLSMLPSDISVRIGAFLKKQKE